MERAELVWMGKRHIEAEVRGLKVTADKPVEKGSTNLGPMPSELFLASLASCTMMSTLRVAEVRKVPVDAMRASAWLDYDAQDRVDRIGLDVHVQSPVPRDEWQVIARMAGKFCTIEQLTRPSIAKRFIVNGGEAILVEKAA
jgi:uncharacterized OsmC-like protein